MALTRRALLVGAGAVAGAGATVALGSEEVFSGRPAVVPDADPNLLNDASGLSPVRVARHVTVETGGEEALATLRAELTEARAAGRPFIASAARHSMGAHSLASQGTAATLRQDEVMLDTAAGTFRVSAGARWQGVIAQLDAAGWSPTVMQSNNDFGVASTFCVNAHGWPVAHGPFGSTVRALRLLTAGGEVVECSRERESDLFRATMGGYGLTGIVLDLDVGMVRNELLEPTFETLSPEGFATRFPAVATDANVRMAYGRLDVSLGRFFEEAVLVSYRPTGAEGAIPAAVSSGFLSRASRYVFRGQVGSEGVKRVRWWIERDAAPRLYGAATRNTLLNEPVATLDDGDPKRTDILHEYFVPPAAFPAFVAACREVIPSSFQDLLNVTLRYVAPDGDSVLAYAPGPRIAAVMLFSQEMSHRAERDMAAMTGELIERTLALGGTYYLPYRPHASRAQFQTAYPRFAEFAAFKRQVDPDLTFRSPFWERYLADEGAS
ncbi:FAD-binding oxidoreductase [Aureimonas sp. ME7]|uniref:FAD-binding oxidoreductase n=1 Tax=Aureimonas sp. ME7 TaxID=2744252 RepID=UPI0032B0229B